MSNKIKIYFLGTSSSVPTKTRNLTGVLINYLGDNYLFDAPENVQQQIIKTNQSFMKINNIFITHLHGDHIYGILGLLSTMELNNREKELNIFVPKGYKKILIELLKAGGIKTSFDLKINEVGKNYSINLENVQIKSIKLNHTINTYGYIFKIKDKIGKFNKQKAKKLGIPEGPLYRQLQQGKKIKMDNKVIYPEQVIDYNYKKNGESIAYILDTQTLTKIPTQLKNISILIHEASFLDDQKEKAKQKKHSIASDVAKFAKKINAKKLCIVHISPRYTDNQQILKDTKKYFKNTIIPNDLDVLEIEDYSNK
ncbi:MAG TPA: ribonuclease Z [archaeon]|jgi:ribonuclease Z|nr:ribonuclease Z [archaeon]